MLGFMYQIGIGGVNKDLKPLMNGTHLVQNKVNQDAQFELGLYYFDNDREYSQKSFKWFLLAGEQGHAKAQTFLATLYFNGYGVQKDYSYGLMDKPCYC